MTGTLPYDLVNIELFQEIKRLILEEPLRFDMYEWGYVYPAEERHVGLPPCGTTACIAGWASAATWMGKGGKLADWKFQSIHEAGLLLGLRDRSVEDAVFYVQHWPANFRERYDAANLRTEAAQVAADYIDWICGL